MQRADERVYRDKTGREAGRAAGRTGRVPSADAIAAARRQLDRVETAKVSRQERRRRSIAGMGGIAVSNFTIGLVYAAVFATAAPHRLAMGVLCAIGCASGLLVVGGADWLSRSPAGRWLMATFAVGLIPVGAAVAVLDGGTGSPTILGTLVPMPLVALSTPLRVAVPVVAGLSAFYLVVAAVVGSPGGWYVALHLAGIISISAICAAQGRTAARQRLLLTRLSRVDVLTDCLNRRGFEDRFTAELARTQRTGGTLSLLIFDLDGFKKLNDAHGHAAGDDLLRWVATTLRDNIQPHDVVARLGGDEFVVLLGSAPEADARRVADRLVARLAARASASVGVATLPEHGLTFDALYAHADGDLYGQKATRQTARRVSRSGASTNLRTGTSAP
ncbi:GGDEF domain-containing protein [Planosporangium thailandense]|uniref:GGDEF domain-containing protein n=2 Tax=Planosporangium thailandense TaxID=765197 RepID=A0ABX0XY44_9ACTN|nr:GGDEF domain-containing protein [Planosporangium thailandense]